MVESLGDCETCEEVLECRWPRGGRLCGSGLAGASSPPAIVSSPVVPSRVYLVVDCSGVGYQWAASSVTRCSDCALVMTVVEKRRGHPGNLRITSGVARVTVWIKVINPIHE